MQVSSKKAAPKREKQTGNKNTQFDKDRYYTEEEILEAMYGRYNDYKNKRLFESLKQLLDALTQPHADGFYMLKDNRHLDALYELSTKLTYKEKDAQNRSVFETDTGAILHVKHGEISYEKAVLRTVGKTQRKVYKPFGEQDALNIALAAMHDRSLLPPNRVHISNASVKERIMLEMAFRYVSKNFMPKGKGFIVDNHYAGATFKAPGVMNPDFDRFMYHMKDRQEQDKEQEAQEAQNSEQDVKNASQNDIKSATEKNEKAYSVAKDLLFENKDEYLGSSILALTKDIAEQLSVDDLSLQETRHLVSQLKKDGLIKLEKAQGTDIITAINFNAVNSYPEIIDPKTEPEPGEYITRIYDRTTFGRIAKKIVAKHGDFLGKDQKEFFESLKLKIDEGEQKALFDQLAEEKIIVVEGDKVTKILGTLTGTKIGAELDAIKRAQDARQGIKNEIDQQSYDFDNNESYAKIISNVIENRDEWLGKERKDVLATLGKSATDKEGIAIWERLQKDGYIAVNDNKIVDTASKLKGTRFAEQLKAAVQGTSLNQDVNEADEESSPLPEKLSRRALKGIWTGAVKVGKVTGSVGFKAAKVAGSVSLKAAKATGVAGIKVGKKFAESKAGKATGDAIINMGSAFYKAGTTNTNPFFTVRGMQVPRTPQQPATGGNGPEAGTQP